MDRYQKEKPVFCSAFNPLIPLISCVELRATISVLGTLIPNPKIQIWSEKKKKKKTDSVFSSPNFYFQTVATVEGRRSADNLDVCSNSKKM